MYKKYLIPVLIAFVMSVVSSRYLFVGSGLSLIPWGLLALSSGLVAHTKREAILLGGVYGFSQAFIFLWIDKAGKINITQFLTLLVIISLLGLLAALCAGLAAVTSYNLKSSAMKNLRK